MDIAASPPQGEYSGAFRPVPSLLRDEHPSQHGSVCKITKNFSESVDKGIVI